MNWDVVIHLVDHWGFPAAFCVWLMFRVERRLDRQEETTHAMVTTNAALVKTLPEATKSGRSRKPKRRTKE